MVRGAKTLACGTKAMDLPGIQGSVLHAFCPGGCAGADTPLWGTDIYTDDSPVCMAAVHAGVLPKLVRVELPARNSHISCCHAPNRGF